MMGAAQHQLTMLPTAVVTVRLLESSVTVFSRVPSLSWAAPPPASLGRPFLLAQQRESMPLR